MDDIRVSGNLVAAIGASIVLGAFFAFIDPYDATEALPFWISWPYWIAMVGLCLGVFHMMFEWNTNARALPAWVVFASATAASALAVFAAIASIEALSGRPIPMSDWLPVWLRVAVINGALGAISRLVLAYQTRPAARVQPNNNPYAAFLDALPLKFRTSAIYAIASEDHYLRVYTSHGEALIRMRLRDALRLLGAANGVQTHRSWWVSVPSVRDVQKDGGRVTLVMEGGVEVPVSRGFQSNVKDAGLV